MIPSAARPVLRRARLQLAAICFAPSPRACTCALTRSTTEPQDAAGSRCTASPRCGSCASFRLCFQSSLQKSPLGKPSSRSPLSRQTPSTPCPLAHQDRLILWSKGVHGQHGGSHLLPHAQALVRPEEEAERELRRTLHPLGRSRLNHLLAWQQCVESPTRSTGWRGARCAIACAALGPPGPLLRRPRLAAAPASGGDGYDGGGGDGGGG